MKMKYESPRIVAVVEKLHSILCASPALMGSASNEAYTEEDFEW